MADDEVDVLKALTGDERAHEAAMAEMRRYHGLLMEELGRTAPRADGNWNASDLHAAIQETGERYERGEKAG
jgi:hypothetical protein